MLISLVPLSASATDYYVDDSSGNDSNDGLTEGTAWKKVSKVWGFSVSPGFAPGDHIKFKRGEVWSGSKLQFESSGTDVSPIVLEAYGDPSLPLPLLDGSKKVRSTWTVVSGNVYSTTWVVSDPMYQPTVLFYNSIPQHAITTLQFAAPVPGTLLPSAILLQLTGGIYSNLVVTSMTTNTISGTGGKIYETEPVSFRQIEAGSEVTHHGLLGNPTILANSPTGLAADGEWYWDSNTLYLYSSVDPNNLDIDVGYIDESIKLHSVNYVTIQDLAVTGARNGGIYVNGGSNNIVQRTKVFATGAGSSNFYSVGIYVKNSHHNIIRNNVIESVLGNAITLYNWSNDPTSTNNDNLVTANTIINPGGSGISMATDRPQWLEYLHTNTIEYNTIIGANDKSYDGGGIYTMNIGDNNVIRGNTILDGGTDRLRSAGIILDGGTNPTIINANIIENCSNGGISVTEQGHQITDNILINNGSTVRNNGQVDFFFADSIASFITVTGNRMRADGNRKFVFVESGSNVGGHTIDYNHYFGGNAAPFYWGAAPWLDYAAWQALGHDGHSTYNTGIRHVANSGSDTANNCLNSAAPCATIQHALDLAVGNWEMIKVARGTYLENLSTIGMADYLEVYGGWDAAFSSQSYNGALTVVEGQSAAPVFTFTTNVTASQLLLEGFTFTGASNGPSGLGGGITFNSLATGTLTAKLNRMIFSGNTAQSGGGAAVDVNTGASADVVLKNCLIVNNTADTGSGVYVNADGASSTASVELINSTITNNNMTSGPDNNHVVIRSTASGTATVNIGNAILWDDPLVATEYGLHMIEDGAGSTTTVNATHSIIGTSHSTGSPSYTAIEDVVTTDPLFIDTANDNFRLQPTSPGINTGNNNPFSVAVGSTDVFGTSRIREDYVDIGSYEEPSILAGDINLDAAVDLKDCIIAMQIATAISPGHFVSTRGDIDGDGVIGLAETTSCLRSLITY